MVRHRFPWDCVKTLDVNMENFRVPLPDFFEVVPPVRLVRSHYARFGKRFFDIVFALALLPFALPIILIAWAIVRLDGNPGFFSQDRIGRNGKTFRCFKLRTMHIDAGQKLQDLRAKDPLIAKEWNDFQKLKDDPRISKFGKFMCETSIDELPQLFNVLLGQMSIVGPRPFMLSQDSLYREAGGAYYYFLRPGITGRWQVDGRGCSTFVDRVRFDNEYASKISLLADVKLILRTASVVFSRTGQ